MRRFIGSLVGATLCLGFLPALGFAATDALGSVIPAGSRASTIVTLAPSLGELVAALDPGHLDRVIGVSEYTDFPAALGGKEKIGGYNRFNLEKVVALKPGLVLATKDGNAEDQVLHLKELGLKVVVVDTSSLSLVSQSMKQVGMAIGLPDEGEKMALQFEKGLESARLRGKGRPAKSVLLQLGDEPLIVAGGGAFLHEALGVIGARNAYGDSQARYPKPSIEDAVSRDPDTVVILAMGDPEPFEKMAAKWRSFSKLKAVKAGKVRVLRSDTLLRPTLRLIDGLALLEGAVYGP